MTIGHLNYFEQNTHKYMTCNLELSYINGHHRLAFIRKSLNNKKKRFQIEMPNVLDHLRRHVRWC